MIQGGPHSTGLCYVFEEKKITFSAGCDQNLFNLVQVKLFGGFSEYKVFQMAGSAWTKLN